MAGWTQARNEGAGPLKRATRYLVPLAWLLIGLVAGLLLVPGRSDFLVDQQFSPFASTSETELYPSFSPDGASVAYVQYVNAVGQIFVRPSDEAVATQLTRLGERALYPFWSADNTRVYFTSGGALWRVAARGGEPERVLTLGEGSAAMSPDGANLVVARAGKGAYDFLVSSPPGAVLKPLEGLSLPASSSFRLQQFSPDGTKMAGVNIQEESVWIIPYPQGEPRRIELHANPYSVSWFPDSRHVAVTATSERGGWRILLLDTQNEDQVTILSAPDAMVSCWVSPDGKRIAYSTGNADWDIYELGMDGGNPRPIAATQRMELEPRWSPDGKRLVFHSQEELWEMGIGEAAVLLARRDAVGQVMGSARYSPDGRKIAYLSGRRLLVIPAAGGKPEVVSDGAGGGSLAWSRDGDLLAYTVIPPGRVMKVAPGSPAVEVVPKGADGPVAWASDAIVYIASDGVYVAGEPRPRIEGSFRDGEFDRGGRLFYVLRLDEGRQRISVFDWSSGREVKTIELQVNPALQVTSFDLAPDGQGMAVAMGNLKYDLWMVEGFPQPATGLMRWLRPWVVRRQ